MYDAMLVPRSQEESYIYHIYDNMLLHNRTKNLRYVRCYARSSLARRILGIAHNDMMLLHNRTKNLRYVRCYARSSLAKKNLTFVRCYARSSLARRILGIAHNNTCYSSIAQRILDMYDATLVPRSQEES